MLLPTKPGHAGQMSISYIVLITHVQRLRVGLGSNQWQRSTGDRPEKEVVEMEKTAKEVAPEITPAEEIKVSTEQIVAEAKEEIKEAPSRIREKLRQLAAVWEGASVWSSASGSDVVGSSLTTMYGAKFQALEKEHEQGRPDKR